MIPQLVPVVDRVCFVAGRVGVLVELVHGAYHGLGGFGALVAVFDELQLLDHLLHIASVFPNGQVVAFGVVFHACDKVLVIKNAQRYIFLGNRERGAKR